MKRLNDFLDKERYLLNGLRNRIISVQEQIDRFGETKEFQRTYYFFSRRTKRIVLGVLAYSVLC